MYFLLISKQIPQSLSLQGTKLITEDYKVQHLSITPTAPHLTLVQHPYFKCKKPNGQGWRFVQEHSAMNNIVIPCHFIVPNLHTLLASILLKAGCSPWLFLTVVLSVASQWLRPASTSLPLLGKDSNTLGRMIPQGFT